MQIPMQDEAWIHPGENWEPDHSDTNAATYDWAWTVYGNVKEQVPVDAPTPMGKPIVLTTYVEANLLHDMVMGRSVTAVLHLIN